jgi:CRP-like cAMP-binding protein
MLGATRQLEFFSHQPGSIILQQGQHVDYFFMIKRGVVEVVLCPPKASAGSRRTNRKDIRVASMGPGQFFGEIELMKGGQSIASIRAGSRGPVELAALHRDPFVTLLLDSPLTEEMIAKIVQVRLEENRTADRRIRK